MTDLPLMSYQLLLLLRPVLLPLVVCQVFGCRAGAGQRPHAGRDDRQAGQ